MNRPLWLDLFYIVALFAPPTLVATLGAMILSNWLELGGLAFVAFYGTFTVLAIISWIFGLVLWSRIRITPGKR
jgi:hypothetical protein